MSHLILDLETAALPNATAFLDPVSAAKNLVDPAKIKADIEKRTADQIADCGLDWNLNRIVCAGLLSTTQPETSHVFSAPDEDTEREILFEVRSWLSGPNRHNLVGFCIRRFDVPVILQRARYLGVDMPRISLKRYDNPHMTDLYDVLTFDEQPCTTVMRRTLGAFCRRFGIDVPDETSGKDIAGLVAANDWAGVEAHCRADIKKTRLLAERLGVLALEVA